MKWENGIKIPLTSAKDLPRLRPREIFLRIFIFHHQSARNEQTVEEENREPFVSQSIIIFCLMEKVSHVGLLRSARLFILY
jgi:hypothetical protein